jgi:hypothetical protein
MKKKRRKKSKKGLKVRIKTAKREMLIPINPRNRMKRSSPKRMKNNHLTRMLKMRRSSLKRKKKKRKTLLMKKEAMGKLMKMKMRTKTKVRKKKKKRRMRMMMLQLKRRAKLSPRRLIQKKGKRIETLKAVSRAVATLSPRRSKDSLTLPS